MAARFTSPSLALSLSTLYKISGPQPAIHTIHTRSIHSAVSAFLGLQDAMQLRLAWYLSASASPATFRLHTANHTEVSQPQHDVRRISMTHPRASTMLRQFDGTHCASDHPRFHRISSPGCLRTLGLQRNPQNGDGLWVPLRMGENSEVYSSTR